MTTHRIITADFHRNGVWGAPFYVAIVETADEEGSHRYLCVDLSGDPENPGFDPARFAVLRLDQIAAGNIAMHPLVDPVTEQIIEGTGGAAYHGADEWGDLLRWPIREWVHRQQEALLRRLQTEE